MDRCRSCRRAGRVAGSGPVLDWVEAHRAAGRASLAGDDPAEVRTIEGRLDDVLGIHVRRYYYSDALLTDPGSVRPFFSRDLPFFPRLAVTLGWSRIVPRIIQKLDLGRQQGIASRDRISAELDWLDGRFADGRRFLMGDRFTRADVTAASLLAPLVTPVEHPVYRTIALPAAMAATVSAWRDRPVLKWVKQVYADWR